MIRPSTSAKKPWVLAGGIKILCTESDPRASMGGEPDWAAGRDRTRACAMANRSPTRGEHNTEGAFR